MVRMTAKDFDQELHDLYDGYAHGRMSKRDFLDRAGKFAVGGLTAPARSRKSRLLIRPCAPIISP